MSASIQVTVRDGATPFLERLAGGLRSRSGLHRAMGNRVVAEVREYLLALSSSRHATAQKLGAAPSGHLGKAAEKTALSSVNDERAVVSINHPGMSRAMHDVTIKPGPGKKFLAIPVIAEAYNRRAYRVPGLVAVVNGNAGVLMKPAPKGAKSEFGTVWYRLVASVRQPMDRSLLPRNDQIRFAALLGARDYVDMLLQQKGGVPR